MRDTKYEIRDGRLWHREGHYFVPEEEPVVVLRGKDPVAMELCRLAGQLYPDEAHRQSMLNNAALMEAYQYKYPERTKIGCHLHNQVESPDR